MNWRYVWENTTGTPYGWSASVPAEVSATVRRGELIDPEGNGAHEVHRVEYQPDASPGTWTKRITALPIE